jgi:hypothetical protein
MYRLDIIDKYDVHSSLEFSRLENALYQGLYLYIKNPNAKTIELINVANNGELIRKWK